MHVGVSCQEVRFKFHWSRDLDNIDKRIEKGRLTKLVYYLGIMFVAVLFLCILLSGPLSSLILPMTKPDGSADLTSLLNHVTLLEQTVASLQTDVQTNKVQAAEVASLKTELRLSLNDLAVVKAELNDIKQGNSNTNSQLKVELQSTMALAQSTSKQLERLEKDMNATSAGLHMIQKNLSMMSTEVTTLGSDLCQVQNQSLDNKQLLTVLGKLRLSILDVSTYTCISYP